MGVNCRTVGCLAAIGLSLREKKIHGIDPDCTQKDQRQVLSLALKDKMKPLSFFRIRTFYTLQLKAVKEKEKERPGGRPIIRII